MKTEIEKIQEEYKALGERIEALKNTPKFEVGKWYINENNSICNYQGETSFGMSKYNGWIQNNTWIQNGLNGTWRPATVEEVEQHLIAEAKKKLYKKDSRIESLVGFGVVSFDDSDTFYYDVKKDELYYSGSCVYKKGKWAELIEVKDQPILIGGYEVKLEDGTFIIGCKRITRTELLCLRDFMKRNKFETVHFDREGAVSLETINLILERLK